MTYTLITTKTFCSNDSESVSASQNLQKKINMSPLLCVILQGVFSLALQNRDKGAWSTRFEILQNDSKAYFWGIGEFCM